MSLTDAGWPGGPDVQAAFCRVLCDEWARAGVTDAVVSPGSRSTPMLRALDDESRIRVHVVLDERSAGFVALGLGLASGRPAVVVTTSGTAAAELHPAVVEAGQAGVPLLAVTTDRPPELHDVGAPQTVEQAGLYATVTRWAFDPGVPTADASGSWRSLAARAAAEAAGSGPAGPGPVHLNLPFREPLIGDQGRLDVPGRPGEQPWHVAGVLAGPGSSGAPGSLLADPAVVDLIAGHAGGRGVIVAGAAPYRVSAVEPDPAGAVLQLGEILGWPVLAEPRSGARVPHPLVVSSVDALLRDPSFAAAVRPDVVLRIGGPWVSKVLGQWLAGLSPTTPQIAVHPAGAWVDPDRTASHVVSGPPGLLVAAVAAAMGTDHRSVGGAGSTWVGTWREADDAARAVFAALLATGGDLELSEPAIARAALAAVAEGGQLFVSSSMPVRDVEWYGAARGGVRVLSNRGANGIDGVISTALGAALARGAPTTALVGDLAFLYDIGALLWASGREVRLRVLVVDNGGGGIFSFLPQRAAESAERFERYWGTPHGVDLAAVAASYGVETRRIEDRAAFDSFLAAGEPAGVRVGIVRSDRAANVEAHDRIHAEVAAALATASPGL